MKAFLTKYEEFCALCGTPSTEVHHLLLGNTKRQQADKDGIYIPVCRNCHNKIHANGTATLLGKMLGQLAYELNTVANKEQILDARKKFRTEYGKSYF